MAYTLEDFAGTYTIKYGSGSDNFAIQIQPGYILSIGTGQYGDPESDGIRTGVAIVDPNTRERILPATGNPAAYAYLVRGTLNGSSYWPNPDNNNIPELLSYQISMMTTRLDDGGLFKAPSILITIGDPETAGVWGSDDGSGGG